MFKRLIFLPSLIVLIAALSPLSASACSGYPYFSMEDLPEMDLLVRATVIDADDRGYSAVIRVEEYFKGEGPLLLLVSRYNVGLETGNSVRGYDTGCLYSGRGHEWRPGSQGYFGLTGNGEFETLTDSYYGSAHFYVWDGQITYQDGATEGYALEWNAPKSISEDDFVAKLLEAGGRDEPIAPTIDGIQRRPLKRYLMISTETGARYQVNPDRSVTAVGAETARFVSPDDAHVALRVDDDTLGFYYVWPHGYSPEHYEQMIQVPGRDLRFSNDSHMVAVWDDSQLTIYMFRNAGQGDFLHWGIGMVMDTIVSVPIRTSINGLPLVRWSADSRTIAWQDDTGVWRWDLYNDAGASMVFEASSSNVKLLDLSESGRYVRFLNGDGWTLFDSETGENFANALASPGERHLIFVNSEDRPINYWSGDSCKPPLRKNCAVYIGMPNVETIAVFPYQMELLGIMGCSGGNCHVVGQSWHPAIDNDNNNMVGGRYLGDTLSDLRQIAYDPFYGQPAILRGDYQIEFRFYSSHYFDDEDNLPYLDYLDLASIVDSPIASIEWGQPVFYDSFMLTATEYLPRTVSIDDAATAPYHSHAAG